MWVITVSSLLLWNVQHAMDLSHGVLQREWRISVNLASKFIGGQLREYLKYMYT